MITTIPHPDSPEMPNRTYEILYFARSVKQSDLELRSR